MADLAVTPRASSYSRLAAAFKQLVRQRIV